MQEFLQQITGSAGNLLIALVILIGGWLVALIIRAIVRSALHRTTLDNRLAQVIAGEREAEPVNVEDWIARIVYYVIMLLVLVAFFERLELRAVTEPLRALLNQVFAFAPRILAAGVLLLLAWLLATAARFAIRRLFAATNLDERLTSQAGMEETEQVSISETLAQVVYWFIFLLFLPLILDALELGGLLAPVQGMLDQILGFLPNLFGAALILVIGWFIARVISQIVTNLLAAAGVDRLSERTGLSTALGQQTLSKLIGTIVYALVFIPVIISGLNALQIAAISDPATAMLQTLLAAVPNIFGAAIVLGIAYFVGRLVADLVSNVLAGVGFNRVLSWIGLGGEPAEGQRTPAEIVGYLVLLAIMLFAISGAAELLGFSTLVALLGTFLGYVGQVVLAVVVFGLGLYLANLARNVILSAGGAQSNLLAQGARVAIIIFSAALALRQTGIGDDIVNMAFGLLLGALAIAIAIAFGLGGREIAARELDQMVRSLRSGSAGDKPG